MSVVQVVASKGNSEVVGVEVGCKVVVPISFCKVEIRSSEEFNDTGLRTEVLDAFPRDLRLFVGGTLPDPGSFRHYGSHLRWALRNAKKTRRD